MKILVNERRLMGAVAKWATEQSPYHRPDHLELVLDKLHEKVAGFFEQGKLGFHEFKDARALTEFVSLNLRQIPEYLHWNERKNGRQGHGFSGAGHDSDGKVVNVFQAKQDDDFIDLDALERNITSEILANQ